MHFTFCEVIQLAWKWWDNTESQWICFLVGCYAAWKFLRKTILLTWGFLLYHWKKTCHDFLGSNLESLADFSNWEVTAPTMKWDHVSAPWLHQQELSGLTSPVAVGWHWAAKLLTRSALPFCWLCCWGRTDRWGTNILSFCTAWPGACLVLSLEKVMWEQNAVNNFCIGKCC